MQLLHDGDQYEYTFICVRVRMCVDVVFGVYIFYPLHNFIKFLVSGRERVREKESLENFSAVYFADFKWSIKK